MKQILAISKLVRAAPKLHHVVGVSDLVLCGACHRHVRSNDAHCPFCQAAVTAVPRRTRRVAAGASRSRRYAVSAAFAASSVAFACGETTNDPATSAGTGGSATGGTTSNGGVQSTGGAQTTGGRTGGGATSTGGAPSTGGLQGTGGAQARGGSGGAVSSGGQNQAGNGAAGARSCTSAAPRGRCRSAADCPTTAGGQQYCQMAPCQPNPGATRCPPAGCPTGQLCQSAGTCGETQCVPACDQDTCEGTCMDGVCIARPCEEDGAAPCGEGYVCDPSVTTPAHHCVPRQCQDGFECPTWLTCGDGDAPVDQHGCTGRRCSLDTDCGECGYCVNSQCAPDLGICYELPAMPYGCVWPDEELI